MQRRGWGLTRASRIVIILLVVQYLGLGQVLAVASVTTGAPNVAGPTQALAALDTAVSLVTLADTDRHSSAAFGEYGSRVIPPDQAPLPRRLPRAPPAV